MIKLISNNKVITFKENEDLDIVFYTFCYMKALTGRRPLIVEDNKSTLANRIFGEKRLKDEKRYVNYYKVLFQIDILKKILENRLKEYEEIGNNVGFYSCVGKLLKRQINNIEKYLKKKEEIEKNLIKDDTLKLILKTITGVYHEKAKNDIHLR